MKKACNATFSTDPSVMRVDLNKSRKRLFFSIQLSGQNNLPMLYMVKETAIEYFGGVLTKLACVAGRRKGSKQPREYWEESRRERSRASRAAFFFFPSPSSPAMQAITK